MQIMSILWDNGRGMTTHEIIDAYPEPRPALLHYCHVYEDSDPQEVRHILQA